MLAGPALAQTTIRAKSADAFVASMGVNVHMEYSKTPYARYGLINDRLTSLGMRHIRDEINDPDPAFVTELNAIGDLGYTLDGLIEGGNDYPTNHQKLDPTAVVSLIDNLHSVIDAVEGPDEPDDGGFLYGPGYWHYPRGAVMESVDLWNIVKGSSVAEVSSLPIVVMSEGTPQDFARLAAIPPPAKDYSNYGNMHAYQGGMEGDHQLSNVYMRTARILTGNEPLWTTEMGYHNYTPYLGNNEQQGVSQRASAIYLPIAFLSGFQLEVMRTFSYELIDEVDDPTLTHKCGEAPSGLQYCSGEGHYGLLNFDGSPKPAFTALQHLIEILQEPGAPEFKPGELPITISGAPGTMRETLLQKSDGEYYLAIWNDVLVYRLATSTEPGADVDPPAVPVTLTFSQPYDFTVYAPNDATGAEPTCAYTLSSTANSIELNLPAQVLLIKITSE
jgi:hypothetical protein